MTDAFVGIDVAFAKGKRLPVCVCTWQDGRLVPVPLRRLGFGPPVGEGNVVTLDDARVAAFARAAAEYVRQACEELRLTPKRIAIDAPSAACASGARRRAAEVAMDEAGISCFATPSADGFDAIREKVRRHLDAGGPANRLPHGNQLWMLVGFALFRELARVAPCLEVFPQATARVLGTGAVHKSRSGGIDAQLAEAARHTGWPTSDEEWAAFEDTGFGDRHDRLDAYLSAWVAALEEKDRRAFGMPPDDVIWTPLVGEGRFEIPAARKKVVARSVRQRGEREAGKLAGGRVKRCPACETFEFMQWPSGWDAHAAHRCEGLSGGDPETRKREFRRRFGALFGSG
jgi:hypothetical protein